MDDILAIYRDIIWLLDHESHISEDSQGWLGVDYQDCLDMADGIMFAVKKEIEKRIPAEVLEIERRNALNEED